MLERLPVLIIALLVLSFGFGLLEARWPAVRGQRRLRTGLLTDVTYWLFLPTLGKLFTGVVVFVLVLTIARVLGAAITGDELRAGISGHHTAIGEQPVWLQLIEFIVLADFLAYWQHRAFHHFGRLWRIHAIHHSSTELDWLSSVRVHPLNDAIASSVVATPLLLLGFSPTTLAAYMPLLTLYAIFIHANVSWSLGPLRYIVTTPALHRWHHSAEREALNKNFAGLLPAWDMVFGTFYMPAGRLAANFGVIDQVVPAGFIGQLAHPFRKEKGSLKPAVTA
jgi:sterol desaturase/sphingolipid hydroxylase (fatty acid hydroxylase superfamily)